ncbi:DUF1275 domain-containing protein (plasmid) [Sphingomonas paeninsulae]|uniref:DUF1275 domain-containing protein n=1 Tax=Sphingomonas paeninsulae TaxID=2319844 RepID=A0A494T6U1_SPHPE|nr:YoaK family protein [Sphingomonas paeninsulae]AYJ84590.1 DUF1275 domain-containing protein [Sphingomonas paeninsulae]
MIRHSRAVQALAIALAALAGYVDAVAYIETGGFFVSFMSGNTTRLGVGLSGQSHAAAIAFGLIGCFVMGVTGASLAGDWAGRFRRVVVLSMVSVLLVASAVLASFGDESVAIACLAVGMGAENAVVGQAGETPIGLTYMTGTIVNLGRCLAIAIRGGDPVGWRSYLLLWCGLLSGAVLGASADHAMGMSALWLGAGLAAVLALISAHRQVNLANPKLKG